MKFLPSVFSSAVQKMANLVIQLNNRVEVVLSESQILNSNESKKRKSHPEQWQRNVNKRNRNSGQQYRDASGVVVPPKMPPNVVRSFIFISFFPEIKPEIFPSLLGESLLDWMSYARMRSTVSPRPCETVPCLLFYGRLQCTAYILANND